MPLRSGDACSHGLHRTVRVVGAATRVEAKVTQFERNSGDAHLFSLTDTPSRPTATELYTDDS